MAAFAVWAFYDHVVVPALRWMVNRPAFNAYLYFRSGYWIGRNVAHLLYRVRLGCVDQEGLACIWPLAPLIRAMGAYFVRRNSRDALYRRVLERYVAMATHGGVAQAVFSKGG